MAQNTMRPESTGTCESCGHQFGYTLIHNGFNESAFAYCDQCGITALFDGWSSSAPKDISIGLHGPITPEAEVRAAACACGGHFLATAAPRCPACHATLSAEKAADYIERNARGTSKGWRWQRNWRGLYAIVIEDRLASDPWHSDIDPPSPKSV
ncbi:MAG TPA: hypothetical protein VM096_02590 [Vicinamibacterales bacterium]|nr:hypothetical protein [Vicinamibacterales bacterium]